MVLADGDDKRAVAAARRLDADGLATAILLDDPVAHASPAAQRAAETSPNHASIDLGDPLHVAALMVATGEADACVGGATRPSADVVRAALYCIGLAPGVKTISSCFVLVLAPIAVGAIWRLLVIPGFGPVPFFLDRWFDLKYQIGSYPDQALWTSVIMDVWHWTPFVTLTMLAGLSAIPKEPVEQAKVDGANRFQVFWYVTLPFLRPVLLTTVFIRIMDAIRTVDEVWMLAGGGPGTRFTGIYIWRVVFPRTDYGYGSSISLITLYLTIVLCWLLFIAISGRRKGEVE